MNCKEIMEYLEEYIYDDLDQQLNLQITAHLHICPHCMEEYTRLNNSIKRIKEAYNNIDIPQKLQSITVSKSGNKKNKRYLKRALIAAACVFALLLGTFLMPDSLMTQKVIADEYRGGFNLIPLSVDATGVKPDSEFILKSKKEVTVEELISILSIDGEPAPSITQKEANLFSIKPSGIFEQNRLYTFRIKQKDSNDITWTFQTNSVFKISGVFPGDKTTNVPTNSGIEIYFSHEDYENIDNFFEISPSVQGRFERHKRAVVFVPKTLKEGTLYTVKIKKGLMLIGTDYALQEDYVFQFETTNDISSPDSGKGFFNYSQWMNEFVPGEEPYLSVYFHINQGSSAKVKTSVYSYNDTDSFIKELKKKASQPTWAFLSSEKNTSPVAGLKKVLEFEQVLDKDTHGQKYIKIPDGLPEGFYLVDSKWEDINFQTLIQVTEIGMYAMNASNKTLVWLNDLKEQKPIDGAKATLIGTDKEYFSDSQGIIFFDTIKNEEKWREPSDFYIITTEDGKSAILTCQSQGYNMYGESSQYQYWNYLHLDRNLYRPDDTVNFWGLVKNRYSNEYIDSVTVEVNHGSSLFELMRHVRSDSNGFVSGYYPTEEQPLIKKVIKAENGIFKGRFELPNLEPGGYQLTVKKDGKAIINSYLSVQNFTKPSYKLEIIKDKEAVFPGEEVTFDIKASFFEGTNVPDLNINYNISSNNCVNIIKNAVTDSTGSVSVKYSAKPTSGTQGEQSIYMYASTTLPEMGEISRDGYTRLFVNDINVNLASKLKDNKAVIDANVNQIVLDRLNNGTAKDSNDFLGDAVKGKTLTGTIYKNTWIKVETGEYYDYINKVTQKNYRYDPKKEKFKDFSITTDAEGKASFSFDAPKIDNGHYTAVVNCQDNSDRAMKFDIYIGDQWRYYDPYEDNRYHLDGGSENYKLGDKVELTYKKGREVLPEGRFLFVKSQNGIRDYEIKNAPQYSFTVEEKDVPNVYVTGVYFNGITYIQSQEFNAMFDYKEKNLVLDAKLDKDFYKPGEDVTVKITATDKNGNPQKAVVNASIVDEALFSLSEQYMNTLSLLYASVPSGSEFSYQSHMNSSMDTMKGGPFVRGGGHPTIYWDSALFSMTSPTVTSAKIVNTDFQLSYGGTFDISFNEPAAIREDFRDTANFETITLNDDGYGELKLKLPDNITSWRVTLSGVTPDLHAGSNKVSLNVTLPFFINYTLNTTYLVGDKPTLGVTAYGNDLKKDDTVVFEVSSPQNPSYKTRSTGKAFERVDIPLWEMTEGKIDIIIKAASSNGLQDSLKHTITAVKTYHQIDEALFYDLKPGLKVEGGATGNTRLLIADKGRGAFVGDINSLRYTSGNRIEQKLSVKVASELMGKYFKQYETYTMGSSFKALDYQREDGGIALLPYGSSDLDVSAKITSLVKDEVNVHKLKNYFYTCLYDDSPGVKGSALYGLTLLGEPVLLNLDKASQIENIDVKDLIYIALAYYELGEIPKADRIYTDKIAAYIQKMSPYYRINTGKDNDDILECTSLVSLLAAKLDKPHKSGFYQYCLKNSTKDILTYVERLLYLIEEIRKTKDEKVSFKYTLNGETHSKTLEYGETYTITIPSINIKSFKIESVEGDAALVSMFKKPLTSVVKVDDNISVKRTYSYRNDSQPVSTFKQNDIIKVVINWDIGSKAIDGSYQITDYLPSGLKPIENPINMGINPKNNEISWREIDGQKVTFHVGKGWRTRHVTYYARVITPGTYNVESTIIQSDWSKESVNFSEIGTIVIN